ncbi:hypothetical protein GBAR_LOCUS7146 [Geodia barretti]|uniref:Uncharacterized protein n=1 Tax=Geodia barretti TaxID=519541 RepID=A0AA35W8A6_GEOBA|nr:hypothetical protein GBAR_LOCUS7146 [Geodia barretti]
MAGAIQLVVLCALLLPCVDVSLAQVNATQMAVAVYETLSPFMTEMRESLAAVKTEMREGLAAVKTEMAAVKTETREEELEALNTIDLKLDLLDAKQDTLDAKQDTLDAKQDTLDAKQDTSAENHVTLIESQLTSVNASIGNELRMVKRLLSKNDTAACETSEVDTHPEDLLQTLLNSQSELELRVLSNITKELEMSAEYHVTAFESTLASGLSSWMLLKVLSNNTKELRRSAEIHVTAIESQLTLVDAGIRNELRKIESQISKNSTGPERVELEIFSNEDVLETLVSVNTSISGQVRHINEGLEHISSSVDSVIVGLQECVVGGGQNYSRQPLEECKEVGDVWPT